MFAIAPMKLHVRLQYLLHWPSHIGASSKQASTFIRTINKHTYNIDDSNAQGQTARKAHKTHHRKGPLGYQKTHQRVVRHNLTHVLTYCCPVKMHVD